MTTTTKLIELVNDYARTCRLYGNPAWDCKEGVALKAALEAQAKQIEALRNIVTNDTETKADFIARVRASLGKGKYD